MGIRDRAKQGRIVTINDVKYFFRCEQVIASQFFNSDVYGIKLEVKVFELDKDENIVNELTHKRIKGTYIAQKIEQFIRNTINGQATFYWDWDKSINEMVDTEE